MASSGVWDGFPHTKGRMLYFKSDTLRVRPPLQLAMVLRGLSCRLEAGKLQTGTLRADDSRRVKPDAVLRKLQNQPPNLLGNLQYRLQDVRVPTLGTLQHEGKSAHILRSSRAGTFSITRGQVRRMLPKLLFPHFV